MYCTWFAGVSGLRSGRIDAFSDKQPDVVMKIASWLTLISAQVDHISFFVFFGWLREKNESRAGASVAEAILCLRWSISITSLQALVKMAAHQTASKGWRWSPWKDFQRSVLSICIRWSKGSSKLEHALRVQLHWQQKYVAYHKIDSYAQHVDSAFDKKDHRQKARGMSFCHMFLWKFGFPERICPPRLILLLYIVLWQDMAGCQNFLERVEQHKYAVYSVQYTLL